MQPVPEPHPLQKVDDIGAILALLLALDPVRQGDVLISRHVIKKAKILENHADAPPRGGNRGGRDGGDVLIENAG